jgi:hypothetical protein
MKEKGTDHAKSEFKVINNGWHVFEFTDGIDYAKEKDNPSNDALDKNGNKSLLIPSIIKDSNDPDDSAKLTQRINIGFSSSGGWMASLLICVGLWDAICKKFPGDDVSVFDEAVLNGIKVKLPGLSCMMRTEIDKAGYAKVVEMASFTAYKKIQTEEAVTDKGGKKTAPVAAPKAAGEEW